MSHELYVAVVSIVLINNKNTSSFCSHLASSKHCFWISDTYYQNSTDIISSIQQSQTNTEQLFQTGTVPLQSQTSTYPQQSQTDTDPQQTGGDQQSDIEDTHPQTDTSSVSD